MNCDAFGSVGEIVAAILATPTGRRFWQEAKHFYAGSQAQALDARIARGQLPDIRKIFLMDLNGSKPNRVAHEELH